MYKAKKVNCSRAPHYFSIYPPHFFISGETIYCVYKVEGFVSYFLFFILNNKIKNIMIK